MDIAVLTGGFGTERNVSLTSGKKIAAALRERGHNVVLLDIFLGHKGKIEDIPSLFKENCDFIVDAELNEQIPDLEKVKALRGDDGRRYFGENVEEICRCADICFLGLHGDVGENGKLQAALDLLGIRYTGSGSFGAALAMNKGVAKSLFLSNKIPTPMGAVYTPAEFKNGRLSEWELFPCVVKPCSGGSSVGVSIVNSVGELHSAAERAFFYENEILVEKFIKGREFSVAVLGETPLPVIEIIPKSGFYDYVNKYQSGKTLEVCPAELDAKTTEILQKQAVSVLKALHLEGYARVDFLLDGEGGAYCLEANTLPGMTPMSLMPQEAAAMGISYGELCEKIIEISMKKYGVEI